MLSSEFAALLSIPLTKTLCSCLMPFSANAKDLPPINRTSFRHGCLLLRVVQFVQPVIVAGKLCFMLLCSIMDDLI